MTSDSTPSRAQAGSPTYSLHGVHLRTAAEIGWWPQCSAPVTNAWDLTFESSGADLLATGMVLATSPTWRWSGLPPGSGPVTRLDFSAGPELRSARRFEIDWKSRTISVTPAQPDPSVPRGTLDLLARWVLPLIARAERTVLPVHGRPGVSTAAGVPVGPTCGRPAPAPRPT